MNDFDMLRLPLPLDITAPAYKDWFHLNLFDHTSGSIGLVNMSLHGSPDDPRARAVATALFHCADGEWRGNIEAAGFNEATVLPNGVLLAGAAIVVDPDGRSIHASVELPDEGLSARLSAVPVSRPIRIELSQPVGSGWISWFVAPRVALSGEVRIGGELHNVASWSAYHDHNWGRWFWGEDIGWEWGAFSTATPGPLFVMARLTDRLHRRRQAAQLIVMQNGQTRIFPAGAVSVRYGGSYSRGLRRLPGALAAMHGDRSRPDLPEMLVVEAASGLDWVRLTFEARAAAQLIAGEPTRPGYAFIHEMAGQFEAIGRLREEDFEVNGLGVFEYVT